VRKGYRIGALAAFVAMTAPAAAQQQDDAGWMVARERTWHVSGFLSRWVESNLPPFVYNVATGRAGYADSYFAAGALAYAIVPRFDVPFPGTEFAFRGNSLEIEGQVLRHFGLQDHFEGTLAAVLRSGEIPLFGGLSANVAWGNGFSIALDDPKYEKGPDEIRGVDSRRFQYYMGFEAELTHASQPNIHLVAKLHHRSGIYGVIAPRHTGSNFIGAGVRFDIR
jgi:hypothetical protein